MKRTFHCFQASLARVAKARLVLEVCSPSRNAIAARWSQRLISQPWAVSFLLFFMAHSTPGTKVAFPRSYPSSYYLASSAANT